MLRRSSIFTIAILLGCVIHAQERFINIDNTRIWVNTIGIEERKEGQPIIVFESGLGTPMGHWDKILEGVAELAPLITYDRPGIGKSDPGKEEPTIKNVSDKLIKILNHLDISPPYVLVGHSLGGLYIRGFASYYPKSLAGLVIIDPADFTETHKNKREYYNVLSWDDKKIDSILIQQKMGLQKRNEHAPESVRAEKKVLAELREREFEEIRNSPLPKDLPVHIITGGRFDMPASMRSEAYDEEAIFRSKMKHRVARWTEVIQSVDKGMLFYSGDAGHFVHYDDPELVISSIRIVLQDYKKLKEAEK